MQIIFKIVKQIKFLLIIFLITSSSLYSSDLTKLTNSLNQELKNNNINTGFILADLDQQKVLYKYNADSLLKPASALKLVTSYVALKELGAEHRFETLIYSTDIKNGHVDKLVIQGGGDPDFKIEELILLVRRLKQVGISSINQLIIDDTKFTSNLSRSGIRAYEAANSALAFNFNSITFIICPTKIGQPAQVNWDPYELNILSQGAITTAKGSVKNYLIDEISPNKYKLSGVLGIGNNCATSFRSVADPRTYFETVLREQLTLHSINLKSIKHEGTDVTNLLFRMQSKGLASIIDDLNHFSNNFIAQQLIYALGQEQGRYDYNRGLEKVLTYSKKLVTDNNNFIFEDGSGLSHNNRISARLLLAVMNAIWNNVEQKVEFERSLAVLSQSGTLKDRRSLANFHLRGKTGSINGVNALAGYLYQNSNENKNYAFALIQNGNKDRDFFLKREDKILSILDREL
jgi:D-alanyl-D-alanine carboxypeptidase/D-alanyl-D-alanine-endopeptidase (penicillin-binding protein 4)